MTEVLFTGVRKSDYYTQNVCSRPYVKRTSPKLVFSELQTDLLTACQPNDRHLPPLQRLLREARVSDTSLSGRERSRLPQGSFPLPSPVLPRLLLLSQVPISLAMQRRWLCAWPWPAPPEPREAIEDPRVQSTALAGRTSG